MTLGPSAARSLAALVKAKQLTAASIAAAALAKAREAQTRLNAFLAIADAQAESEAATIDSQPASSLAELPLAGVPVVVKDNISTAGLATTAGSKVLEGYVPPFDATVVKRLRAAGAVVIAKGNLDEFGMGSTGENSAYGPTLNPHDTTRVAGGSSSGSAAAVAAGVVPVALGTDTGGSSRLPAAFCGVVGFKPSYGALSRYGVLAYASSLDQVGIIGAKVDDVALTFGAIRGRDDLDANSIDLPGQGTAADSRGHALHGKRFGVIAELGAAGFGPAAAASLQRAHDAVSSAGGEVVTVSVPSVTAAVACYYVIAAAEASSNLARYSGMLYGRRLGSDKLGQEEVMRLTRGQLFGREAKRRILLGSFALSAGYYDEYYGRALRVRSRIAAELAAALNGLDGLLLPTAPSEAYRLGEKSHDALAMYLGDVATCLANLAGAPALSLPCNVPAASAPLGVQLMAAPGLDLQLLGHAAELEALLA